MDGSYKRGVAGSKPAVPTRHHQAISSGLLDRKQAGARRKLVELGYGIDELVAE